MKNNLTEAIGDFDTSDSPTEPNPRDQQRRPPPVPVRAKAPAGPPRRLPGANNAPYIRKIRTEAPVAAPRRRRSDQTMPPSFGQQPQPATPEPQMEPTAADRQAIPLQPGESSWDVTVPGDGTYRVPAADANEAKARVSEYTGNGSMQSMTVIKSPVGEATAGGSLMGYQMPTDEAYAAKLKEAVRAMVREIVRKKEGGGGYNLYPPNKGKKKKKQKAVGTFPTRLAAKRAELARFPPKDPEQLKKLRTRMDKLSKDPKKRAEAEKADLMGAKAPKKSGAPAADRKKAKKEAFVRSMVQALHERLFHEDEVPGSPWDEKIASIHPDAISSDKKLHSYHKNMQAASIGALRDAHKAMAKALRGTAKCNPGDVAHDPERNKTFMPVMLDVDGNEVGPVHLYVDGGHVKIEVSDDARQQIAGLEPDSAKDVRGGLMTFQEDHLPEIDTARKAWNERDSYLDKVHAKLEKQFGGMSDVERHLAKPMLTKGGRRK